jgi:2'-5' RNA ligase
MPRLFVALVPPAPVRAGLAELGVPLDGVRWTPGENLHLTLRFIGETTPDKQDAFAAALARVRVRPALGLGAGLIIVIETVARLSVTSQRSRRAPA